MIAIVLPLAIIIAIYFRRRDVYDLHHAILGMAFSLFIFMALKQRISSYYSPHGFA